MITPAFTWKCDICGEIRTYRPYSPLGLERLAVGTNKSNDRRITVPEELVRHSCPGPVKQS